jgi:hypothetical protein
LFVKEGHLAPLKKFAAVAVMIVGGLVFAADPSDFASFSCFGAPGTTTLASTLFITGLALWLQE